MESDQTTDIIESMQDGFLQIDKNWTIISVNNAQEKLSGVPRSLSIGKNVWEVFPEAAKLKMWDLFHDALTHKNSQKFEEHHPQFNLWIEITVNPTQSGGIIVVFRDISDKKKIDLKHIDSEKKFIELADSMPQIVWTSRPDGYVDYFNQRWYDYTGFENTDGGNEYWHQILHPEDLEMCVNTWQSSIKTGQPYQIEYRFKDRFNVGNYRWFLGKAIPFKDAYGNITKWFGTCTDITELKLSKQATKISESQIRFFADALPQQVWTANPDGKLDYVNKRVLSFYEKSFSEMIDDGWTKNIHPDDLQACLLNWETALETGKDYKIEMRTRNPEGKYFWYLTQAEPYIVDGKIIKWFGTSTDIEIQKQNEQLKDDFIAIASHELKSPITPIKGYLQLLQKMLNGQTKESSYVNKSLENVYKLENILNDLQISKVNDNNLSLNKKNFRFDFLLENCVENFTHETASHEITIKNCPEIMVTADSMKIEQVLINCINNAVKYSPNGKKVIVDADVKNKDLVVNITDFGIGIVKENLDKIFDRFFREENVSTKFKGMGLGLYICSQIIKKHQGKLWVNSQLGFGTTISFSLPLECET